jgi:hypothetical protein
LSLGGHNDSIVTEALLRMTGKMLGHFMKLS